MEKVKQNFRRKTYTIYMLTILLMWGWLSLSIEDYNFVDLSNVSASTMEVAKSLDELDRMFPRADTCSGCHKQTFHEWKQSYHSKSMVTIASGFKAYIGKIEKEKGRFPNKEELLGCASCHAPALQFASEELIQHVARLVVEEKKEALAQFSVDCAFCHSAAVTSRVEDKVFYASISDPVSPSWVHQSKYAEGITRAEYCQSCHSLYVSPVGTIYCSQVYEAWKESPASRDGKQCQYCHMKSRDGQAADLEGAPLRVVHAHDFPGGHNPSILQDAVRLSLGITRNDSQATVIVDVNNLGGHRIPDS